MPNKFKYEPVIGDVALSGKLTGWMFSDAVITTPCERCGSDATFQCETPSGRKAWPPHNERVAEFLKTNKPKQINKKELIL